MSRVLASTAAATAVLAVLTLAIVSGGLGLLPAALMLLMLSTTAWWVIGAVRAHIRTVVDAAIRVERARVADELHDFAAHDMTVVMVHAQALAVTTDPIEVAESRRAIARAAARALGSLRATIDAVQPEGGVLARIGTLVDELEPLGYRVSCTAPVTSSMPRASSAVLEHVVTESVTNIIKHGGRGGGEVRITVSEDADRDVITIWSSVRAPMIATPAPTPYDFPAGGTGLRRLSDLLTPSGGTLSAGPAGRGWSVTASIPRSPGTGEARAPASRSRRSVSGRQASPVAPSGSRVTRPSSPRAADPAPGRRRDAGGGR